MRSSKTMVRQTGSKDIDLPRPPDAAAGTPGRKVGQEMHVELTPDRIRVRAYEIYQARSGAPGDDKSDWCQAEAELSGRANPAL